MRKIYKTLQVHNHIKNNQSWIVDDPGINIVNNLVAKLKKDFIEQAINDSGKNSKELWKSLKKILPIKSHSSPSRLVNDDGEITDDAEIAEAFNSFFCSIGQSLASKFPDIVPDVKINTDATFHFEPISTDFVTNQLNHLPNGKATGLDNLSTRLLKASASNISSPLAHIFNCTLETGEIPDEWKVAKVTPVYKDGQHCDTNNYRPISVLPVTSKILERAVHDQLYSYLVINNLLHHSHHRSHFYK